MWAFALLALVCVPVMGLATSLEMKKIYGEDEGVENKNLDSSSPGGIIVETLLNMGTVSALTLQEERYKNFKESLSNSETHYVREGLNQGALAGFSICIQQWINAALFYFGAWLMFKNPDRYDFKDFLTAMFAILFSLFGLGAAFQDITDRKETEKSAARIFYLLDRQSAIDPLSEEGKILDTTNKPKSMKKKKSKRSSSKKLLVEDDNAEDGAAENEDALPVEQADEAEDAAPKKPKSVKKSKRASSKKLLTEENDEKQDIDAEQTVEEVAKEEHTEEEKPKSVKKKSAKKKSTKKKKEASAQNDEEGDGDDAVVE